VSRRYALADLVAFTEGVLCNEGAAAGEARIVGEALVWSDAIGRPNHGLWRLTAYAERFRRGLIQSPCQATFARVAPALFAVDGGNGFGHYVGHVAMQHAMEAASDAGIGLAAVRNSNHFGAGAYFVDLAARKKMIGVATSNSVAKLAPYGGVKPVLGTNPIAIGIPRSDRHPIILDMATAAVSGGSLIRAAEHNQPVPEGVVVDSHGRPVTDARVVSEGAMLPFGGAKGGGLALFVEVLSAVVSGAALSADVRSMFSDFTGSAGIGHCFIAVDVSRLTDLDDYSRRLEELIGQVVASGPDGTGRVRLPGDERWAALGEAEAVGVSIDAETRRDLEALAERTGTAFPACLQARA
jgi:ureidoglycolate dehydrogenase (NAD+)